MRVTYITNVSRESLTRQYPGIRLSLATIWRTRDEPLFRRATMRQPTAAATSVIPMDERARFAQTLGRSFTALVFLLGICASAWGADAAGTVKTLVGSATVVRDSAVLPIAPGQRVYAGDRIVSGRDGYVGVMLYDDTRLTIGPSSEMLIREFEFNPNSYAGDLAVSFLKGTMRVVTGLIGRNSPENVRFNTPTATIGIRGTEFVVDVGTN